MTTYEDAGVHNDLKRDASKILYEAAKKTWENRKGKLGEIITPTDSFSGLRGMRVGGLPLTTICNLGFDGVGTKMEIGERIDKHNTIAYDLFAMVVDDAVVRGAEPVLIGSILDVNSLKAPDGTAYMKQLDQLADGYVKAAKAANVAVVNGEIAELGARVSGYGAFNYNWGAGILWFADEDRAITGAKIMPLQKIVALREYGPRSNGLSLMRKVLANTYGPEWHKTPEGRELAEQVLRPSTIYSAAVCDMFGGALGEPKVEITGIAHITGGGIPEKLGRALEPSKTGATLYNLWEPPSIMQKIQYIGQVSDRDAYKTWNMGNGMLIITPEPDKVIAIAEKHGLEAKYAGEITPADGKINIHTREGKWLKFPEEKAA